MNWLIEVPKPQGEHLSLIDNLCMLYWSFGTKIKEV